MEGEALAIAWSLEQTRYFTQGCDTLVIVTDHKPLVKLFGDTNLDSITNDRVFSFKERTLPWKFTVEHKPGKDNKFADATSRNPSRVKQDDDNAIVASISISEALSGIMTMEEDEDDDFLVSALAQNDDVRAVTWEIVQEETAKDQQMQNLLALINSTFPEEKDAMPSELVEYWSLRSHLYAVDNVVLLKDQVVIPRTLRGTVIDSHLQGNNVRVIIPPTLRKEVVQSLHSAHQGVSGMMEHARVSVYWPGITADIKRVRSGCQSCNRIMPSQANLPPTPPIIPTTPFESIACDFFKYMGYYYFVAADRLSGWIELQKVKVGTNDAGAQGLCKALRRLMVTFGVPAELSSDGGPEFIGGETKSFFERWGISHLLSSVSFPSSNGRAEVAVKTAKRLIMDNVGPDGELDTDAMVRALLTYRNTPDPGCKLSPAQILLGRQLRDTLPSISKDVMAFNNPQVDHRWREAWKAKEEALKVRYVKTLEHLDEHTRNLPPLRHGDQVIIQNQQGRFPRKWDKSGIVVEVKDFDQYVVKVSGSGRLTLRNRKFLRLYTPHSLQNPAPSTDPLGTTSYTVPAHQAGENPSQVPAPQSTTSYETLATQPILPTPVTTNSQTHVSPVAETTQVEPRRLSFGDFPPSIVQPATPAVTPPSLQPATPAVTPPSLRPVRTRKARTIYDAHTGTFKEPVSVPDSV